MDEYDLIKEMISDNSDVIFETKSGFEFFYKFYDSGTIRFFWKLEESKWKEYNPCRGFDDNPLTLQYRLLHDIILCKHLNLITTTSKTII